MNIRQLLVRLLVGSFVIEIFIAELIARLSGRSGLVDIFLNSHDLAPSISIGLLLGAAVALTSQFYFRTFAREITEEFFVPIFRGVSTLDIVLLALLPGLGEEALFRGALQPIVGILPASIIFGLLHTGFSRRLLPYSLWTILVGLLLGALYLWSGNLWGSIVAHAVTNAAGVAWIRRSYRDAASTDIEDGSGQGDRPE